MDWLNKLKNSSGYGSSAFSKSTIRVTFASTNPDKTPKIYSLVFREFIDENGLLVFSGSLRNPEILGILKNKKNVHEMQWNFGQETFTMQGRIYVIGAPCQAHRLGTPTKAILPTEDPEQYWEDRRLQNWKSISPEYRASFSWPVSGQIIIPPEGASWSAYKDMNIVKQSYGLDVGYKYTSLPDMPNERVPFSVSPTSPVSKDERQIVHNLAFDNFCLFVFKPSNVEYLEWKQAVPNRFKYELNGSDWISSQITA